MTDFRDLGKCRKSDSQPYYSRKLAGDSAFKFFKDITTLSVEELTVKYGDLSKLTGYIGGEEE